MSDLAFYVLDIVENLVRADASVISITFEENTARDILSITLEDNSSGPRIPDKAARDPFYTNNNGKRIGLGLCLFRAEAEQAGGNLKIGKSELGGSLIKATMRLSHVDKSPLGDIAAAISSVVCINPSLDIWFRFRVGDKEYVMQVEKVARELRSGGFSGLTLARKVREKINTALASLELAPLDPGVN